MIGNIEVLTDPTFWVVPPGPPPGSGGSYLANINTIPAVTLNLPLPFFFARDSGVALPTAALPYNDMRINFSFRDWSELLIVDQPTNAPNVSGPVPNGGSGWIKATPTLNNNVQVWANYAIVSNDERKRMACAPRDMLIEQVQTAPRQTFGITNNNNPRYDIRFSHAIKVLFFAARNSTNKADWSNYTAGSPVVNNNKVNYTAASMVDPISQTSLIYENTNRLGQMGSDYFSLVNPWYSAPSIPLETGYHMYSYSLDFISLDPMGSTNYGKLTNVSIVPEVSIDAQATALGNFYTPTNVDNGGNFPQTFEFITTAVNNNIIRVSGGALGFPVL